MILTLLVKCIFLLLLAYCFNFLLKLILKFNALRKLYSNPDKSFFFGHLSAINKRSDPNLSPSENLAVIFEKECEDTRDKCVAVLWLTWVPKVIIANADAVEAVLSSNKVLTKPAEYGYFEPWIGTGLLTSQPKKWKQRRKLLTPTFHFRILEDFLKTMNEHSMILIEILNQRSDQVDLFQIIPLTTLDTICETAMGMNINAQRNPKSRFVNSIVFVNESIFSRFLSPLYWFDFVFYRTQFGRKYRKEVDYIHQFSRSIVDRRKDEIIKEGYVKKDEGKENSEDTIFFGSKKRKIAFIDLLIQNHLDSVDETGNHSFTIADICEEVDTFMFEGFETTAAAVSWTLHLLGNNEDVQNKAYEEIASIFGADTQRFVTVEDLNRLKYVECCIKEALRLYPSVPMMSRETTEELNVCGHTIPSGTALLIQTYTLHRDPKYFPNPKEFIPERYLEDQERLRNPYAYIPFSAGPRNCIGQRFAMYEMKTLIANVLRNFSVQSELPSKDIIVSIEIITRTKHPLNVKFNSRY